MVGPPVIMMGFSASIVVVLMIAVMVYLFVIKKPDTGTKKKPPPPPSPQVATIVKLAVTQTPTQVAAAIVKAKITTKATDVTAALRALPAANRTKAIATLLKLSTKSCNACAIFTAGAKAAQKAPPPTPPKPNPPGKPAINSNPPVACPTHYGFHNCTDAKFNSPNFKDGATKAINETITDLSLMSAKDYCCKTTNVWGDPRPDVKKLVKLNIKKVNIGTLVAGLLTLPLSIFLPGVFSVALTAIEAAGFTGSLAMSIAEESMMDDAGRGFPMTGCQGPKPDSEANKSIRFEKYNDEDGKPVWPGVMFQSHNGCPVVYGTPKKVEYTVQAGKAYAQIAKYAGSEGIKLKEDQIPMLPFDNNRWHPGNESWAPPPISCVLHRGSESCVNCTNWDFEGQECRNCLDEDFKVTCGQFADNPHLVSGGWANGYGKSTIESGNMTGDDSDTSKYL